MPKLTFRERFRMSWELTWPIALMDAVAVVVIHGVLDAKTETLDSLWAFVAFFAALPWVVQRALAQRYGPWTIVVRSFDGERTRLKYQESLKVMWLLTWRTLPLALVAILLISLLLRLLHVPTAVIDTQDPLVNALGLSIVDSLASLLLSPFLIPGLLRKKYRGFRLQLKEYVEPPPVRVPERRRRR